MQNPQIIQTIVLYLLLSVSTLAASAQTTVFRYGLDGYTNYADVGIRSYDTDASMGAGGTVGYGSDRLLVKFAGISLPEGLYDADLQLTVKSIPEPGTFSAYRLTDGLWNDPGVTLNPPSPSSLFPTWSHANYNATAWSTPGVIGGSEETGLFDSAAISNAGAFVLSGTASLESDTETLAFVFNMNNTCTLHTKEDFSSASQLPTLTLTLVEAYADPQRKGGLGWNRAWGDDGRMR